MIRSPACAFSVSRQLAIAAAAAPVMNVAWINAYLTGWCKAAEWL